MRNILFLLSSLFLLAAISCQRDYIPKPHGYFRISFQEKAYIKSDPVELPYQFEIPVYGKIVPDNERLAELYWVNLEIPQHKAEVHLSYKKVENNLRKLTEDSRELAYKHSIKADAIDERIFVNPEKKVYGTIYLIDGNTASPLHRQYNSFFTRRIVYSRSSKHRFHSSGNRFSHPRRYPFN